MMPDWKKDLDILHELSLEHKHPGFNLTRVLISSDSFIFIYENKTLTREMLLNSAREIIVWFGSGLSSWTILINLFLAIVMIAGLVREARHQDVIAARNLSRWLALNFTLVQLLLGLFVIPLNVATDRHGGWIYGGTLCRVWLMTKLLLVAETMWSLFVVTFDRFLQTVSSLSYLRWCSWRTTLGEILLSWAISALVLVPTLMSQNDGDFILEEVCATSMSPEHTLFVTLAVFVVPATLILIICGAIGLARFRSNEHDLVHDFETEFLGSAPPSGKPSQTDINERPSHEYCHLNSRTWSSGDSICRQRDTTAGYRKGELAAIIAVSLCCIVQWAPFHITSASIPFCEGFLCINPTLWSLMIWFGYSTAGVAPLCWFLDPWIRRHARLTSCKRQSQSSDVTTCDVITCGPRKFNPVSCRESTSSSNSSLMKAKYPSLQSSAGY